jgi:hypothetical protein
MKKRQSIGARGILGDTLKPRLIGAQERNILDEAERIRVRHSQAGMVRAAIAEINTYVIESRHPIPTKIANLKADLAKQTNPDIREALKRAITKLENF